MANLIACYQIGYTSHITKGGSNIRFTYGADLMRVKQTRRVNGKTITTHYIGKHYEVEKEGTRWTQTAYISDAAIVKNGNRSTDRKIRFTLRDRLGSAVTFVDQNGRVTGYRFFDPFGKPRNGDWRPLSVINKTARLMSNTLDAENTTSNDIDKVTRRGFTDHEHLDEAELIHMNGRVYDYNVGRFLSVDPFVHKGSQGINPYSYILNNPLAGTDPTGYKPEVEAEEPTYVETESAEGGLQDGEKSYTVTYTFSQSVGIEQSKKNGNSAGSGPSSNGSKSSGSSGPQPSTGQSTGPGVGPSDISGDTSKTPSTGAGSNNQRGDRGERSSKPTESAEAPNNSAQVQRRDDGIAVFGTAAGIARQALQDKKDVKLNDSKRKSRLNPNTMESNKFHRMLRWAKRAGQFGFAASIASRTDKLMQMRANPNVSAEDMAWEYADFVADMAIGTFGMLGGWPGIMVGAGYSYLDSEAPGGNLLRHGWNQFMGRREDD